MTTDVVVSVASAIRKSGAETDNIAYNKALDRSQTIFKPEAFGLSSQKLFLLWDDAQVYVPASVHDITWR